MKKILLLTAGMLLIAASCTKNEVVEVNQDGNEIQYSVVANKATKAADIYCNSNKPSEFTVFAESDGKTYIDGDKITSTDGNTWVNESGTRFWPNESAVDFYAVVNGNINWNPAAETSPASIVDYTVSTDVTKQNDLLYAVKMEQKRGETAENTEAVTLNFRHALSQIVFQAKNTNENLYVEISGVEIVNVADKNTFTFPTKDTDNVTLVDGNHDGTFDSDKYSTANWGVWNELAPESGAAGGTVYPVKFTTVAVPGKNTNAPIVNLTNNVYTSEAEEFNTNALLLLPQTSNAWKPEAVPAPGLEGNADNGSYFLVNCAIYNVAGDEFDEREDTPLWGTKGAHKQAAIPVAINWEQGKKYIYTFIFGEGGGYDPDDPDPEDPDKPDPVLIPITFEVTVDDFVTVANEVDMEVQEGTMTPGN